MIQADPLAFLDEYSEAEEPSKVKSDPLSFLDESSKTEQQTIPNTAKANGMGGKSDPLSFLDEPQESFWDKFKPKPYSKTSPDKSIRQNVLDIYTPEEKTPEQLKNMSIQERMEYAQDLQNLRDLQSGTGIVKGALSGVSFGLSEKIPGLAPDENDLMVGLGETLGSYLPISKLYNFIGKPLVNYAAKSPVAREGLMALARMTGFGVTGAAYEGAKEAIKTGEVPSPEELAKTGATWAAIDGVLQTMGAGVAFSRAVKNIAESEGVTAKEVLGKLWDATKAKFKRPIHADEIGLPEVETLVDEAKNTEIEIARKEPAEPKGIEFEEKKALEFKPKEEIAEPKVKSDKQIEQEITEAKDALADLERTQGKGATHERSGLIQKVNELELEKYNRAKAAPKEKAKPTPGQSFTTSKGSTYQINEDGSTTRTKAARAEHPGEEGLQPKSEKTWYVTPDDANKLSEFQAIGESKKIFEFPNGKLGVQYISGKHKGKVSAGTVVDFSKEPKEGMIPVEAWDVGKKIHFGNQITKIERVHPKQEAPEPKVTKEPFVIPENKLVKGKENGKFYYEPAGVVGDYITNPEVRNALKDILDYPVRYHNPALGGIGFYEKGQPISISRDYRYDFDRDFKRVLLEEAIHALQDKKSRLGSYAKNKKEMDYENIPQEMSAKKFVEWALEREPEIGKYKTEKPRAEPVEEKVIESKEEAKEIVKPPKKPKSKLIDERPILKEIMDLKEQLKSEKSRPKKERIVSEIRQKAKELGQIREQNKQQPLEKEFGKPDVTTKGLREQKKFILEKIDDALENPPDTNQITIDVPGDGIFRINNEPRILEDVRKKVVKEWPKTGVKEPKEPALKSAPTEAETTEELPKKKTQIPPRQTRPRQPVFGKNQAVARSKIVKLFRDAFTDPIRLGKFKQRALGIHKLWPKVTRLLKDNDIETVAHEIGHNLHTTLYGGDAKTPQEQARNIEKALKPYLDELKPLAHYEPWGMEGFAEFTRLYVTNPDVAKDLAPKFYDKFENDLRAEYPEMLNALLEAREYYDAYLQGTPQSRIRAQTNYASDKGKLANIIEAVKKKFHPDNLKTHFLDDVFPAKRLVAEAFGIPLAEVENLKDERNLYRALRVLKGAVGKGDVFVLHETFSAKTLDKINGSLRDILKQLPNEEAYREFNDYLIARRALEKTAQDIETGINAGDALAVELDLRPKYGQLARELDKYNDSLLNYARDAGLLSNQQYAAIKSNNLLYVPFQRVIEPEKGGVAAGGGKLQAGKPIKRMKGSARDIIAPIESVLKNTYSIIINAEKNLAGQTLASIAKMKNMGGYVEHVPVPTKLKGKIEGDLVARELAKRFESEGLSDLIEYDQDGKLVLREDIADAIPEVFLKFGAGQYPAGENIVTVYFDGKPRYYEVSPEIFEMWNKGIAPYTAGLLTKILRVPARTLRAGAILNPKFMMKNIVRDTWGSWLFTKYGKSVKDPAGLFIDTLFDPLAKLATAIGKGNLYVEWMKSGGSMSTMQSLDRDSVVKKLDDVRGKWQGIQPIKWLRQAAGVSEEANRLSEFGKALAVEGKTRLGREIAAFAARDLSIDFAKIGLQTKALNQIIPFWNATVQGGDKLLRTLANPEDRKNFLPRIIGFIVLPSLMLAWLNKDDERVKEFYEAEKDSNFITFVGDEAIKIPVPFETGVMVHGLTQRMFNHFMKDDPEAFDKFMGSIASAMLPNFIPTLANPIIETYANKNFFTGARIVPLDKEQLISKYQYKRGTSSTARLLGRAMTYMLGDPDTRSKAASPAVIDHFIHSWTGGLGRTMINISDASLEAVGLSDKIPGPNHAITEKLGFDAFSVRYPRASTRSIEKFYDNYADATARKKSLKYVEKMDLETEEDKKQAYERFDKIYDYNTLKNAYKAMQNCQKEINNIYNDPSIEPELKKKMIDDLYLQKIDFAKRANEDIREYRLTQED